MKLILIIFYIRAMSGIVTPYLALVGCYLCAFGVFTSIKFIIIIIIIIITGELASDKYAYDKIPVKTNTSSRPDRIQEH